MAEEPWRSSTVPMSWSRLACREGRRFARTAYHTVLTADTKDHPFLTDRRVVGALSRIAMSM